DITNSQAPILYSIIEQLSFANTWFPKSIEYSSPTDKQSFPLQAPQGISQHLDIQEEDKVATLKYAIEGLLRHQGHQELSANFNLYVFIPTKLTAKVSEYFNATPDPKQVHVIVKPKE
ncbi:19109_t:CDS:2, partial [Entrophospora sp. SA101]